MHVLIKSTQDLGLVIRATRRSQNVRQDDVSGSAGVGHVFTREVEHGKETVQLGRVMRLLDELGISLILDMPSEAADELASLRKTGLRPIKRRAGNASAQTDKD